VIVRELDQAQLPAGTFTVSPAEAEEIAADTSAYEQLAALIIPVVWVMQFPLEHVCPLAQAVTLLHSRQESLS
jgi:hypothetical protein